MDSRRFSQVWLQRMVSLLWGISLCLGGWQGWPSLAAAHPAPAPEVTGSAVTQVKATTADNQLRIDGSDTMVLINQWLQQRFQQLYPHIDVILEARGTETALDEVVAGDIDLAAIGRPLSEAEKARGLRQLPVSHDSIAVVVGRSNPFMGSLTVEQFAQILQGELTDWAQLGRQPGEILVIDRPQGSDTRQALLQHPRFQDLEAPLSPQEQSVTVADTAAMIRRLGRDGIGYAIASQVQHQPQVRVVKIAVLLDTLPGDAIYPYNSLRGYVYRADNKSVQAFLGLVQEPAGQLAIDQAKAAEADAIAPKSRQRSLGPTASIGLAPPAWQHLWPLWWLLLVGLLLGLAWWLSQRQQPTTSAPAPTDEPAADTTAPAPPTPPEDRAAPEVATAPPAPEAPPPETVPGPDPVLTYIDQGQHHLAAADYAAALAAFDAALNEDSTAVSAWFGRGQALLGLGQTAAAITSFGRALDRPPTPDGPSPSQRLATLIYKGKAHVLQRQFSQAITHFNLALGVDADNAEAVLEKGQVLLVLRRYDEALPCFERVLTLKPEWVTAWLGKGITLAKLERYQDAVAAFDQAIELAPQEPSLHFSKGDALLLLGQAEAAQQVYRQAAALVPESQSPSPTITVGDDPAASIIDEARVIDISIQDPHLLYQRGRLLLQLGRLPLALTYLERAVGLNPEDAAAWIAKGQTLLRLGQASAALADFEAALGRDAAAPDAWQGRGDALVQLGETVAARDSYERAQTLRQSGTPGPESLRLDLAAGVSAPGSGRTALSPAPVEVLDVVIVIDNDPALAPEVSALSAGAEAAIAQVSQRQPLDLRLVWLGLEAAWPQSRCDRSVADFLAPQAGVTRPSPTPEQLLAALVEQGGWRPEANRAIWYLGVADSHSLDTPELTTSLIRQAQQAQVKIHTYWKSRPDAVAQADQSRLAHGTGGLSRILTATGPDAAALLSEILLNSCQECTYRRLVIDAPQHCYGVDLQQLASLQSAANATVLAPGDYMVRISRGAFSYWPDGQGFEPDPWVVLWIHGGRMINKQTGVEGDRAWVVLNGYGDALVLRVLEPTHLCALFLDTYREDNTGQVDITILEMT